MVNETDDRGPTGTGVSSRLFGFVKYVFGFRDDGAALKPNGTTDGMARKQNEPVLPFDDSRDSETKYRESIYRMLNALYACLMDVRVKLDTLACCGRKGPINGQRRYVGSTDDGRDARTYGSIVNELGRSTKTVNEILEKFNVDQMANATAADVRRVIMDYRRAILLSIETIERFDGAADDVGSEDAFVVPERTCETINAICGRLYSSVLEVGRVLGVFGDWYSVNATAAVGFPGEGRELTTACEQHRQYADLLHARTGQRSGGNRLIDEFVRSAERVKDVLGRLDVDDHGKCDANAISNVLRTIGKYHAELLALLMVDPVKCVHRSESRETVYLDFENFPDDRKPYENHCEEEEEEQKEDVVACTTAANLGNKIIGTNIEPTLVTEESVSRGVDYCESNEIGSNRSEVNNNRLDRRLKTSKITVEARNNRVSNNLRNNKATLSNKLQNHKVNLISDRKIRSSNNVINGNVKAGSENAEKKIIDNANFKAQTATTSKTQRPFDKKHLVGNQTREQINSRDNGNIKIQRRNETPKEDDQFKIGNANVLDDVVKRTVCAHEAFITKEVL